MTLSAEAMQGLASAARRRGATISHALVAALAEAVSSVTGATDMVIGALVANHGHPTLADAVTCSLDAVSLRLRGCGQGLDATVTECRTEMTDALNNLDLPLPEVTRLLGAGDSRGRPPHDLLFVLQNRPAPVLSTGGLPVQVFQPTSRRWWRRHGSNPTAVQRGAPAREPARFPGDGRTDRGGARRGRPRGYGWFGR